MIRLDDGSYELWTSSPLSHLLRQSSSFSSLYYTLSCRLHKSLKYFVLFKKRSLILPFNNFSLHSRSAELVTAWWRVLPLCRAAERAGAEGEVSPARPGRPLSPASGGQGRYWPLVQWAPWSPDLEVSNVHYFPRVYIIYLVFTWTLISSCVHHLQERYWPPV